MTRAALFCILGTILFGLFLASVRAGSTILHETEPHIELKWEVLDDPLVTDPTEVDIEFTVTTDTTGWVGIGFALTPSMFPSDNIIMWVSDSTDEGFAEDRFAIANEMPILDTESGGTNDVQLISSEQTSTGQTFVVRRKLETEDTMHDHVIGPDPLYLLWAVGETDQFTDVHVSEGATQLVLVGDQATSESVDSSASSNSDSSSTEVDSSEMESSDSASGRFDSLSDSSTDEDSAASTTRAALGLISTLALLVAAL